jgi:acetyl-CoA carboxylase biotin carboxyl carrier protein
MTNSKKPSSSDVFDIRHIRGLVELMSEKDLNEIDLRQGDTRIRIRRGAESAVHVIEPRGMALPHSSPAPPTPTQASKADAKPTAEAEKNHLLIKSPTVGTFYSAPEPGKPPFVKVGDTVGPDTTVCIIEAMKVFNAIPAEVSGRIAAVLVQNEQPVEYNQPLFKVEPM